LHVFFPNFILQDGCPTVCITGAVSRQGFGGVSAGSTTRAGVDGSLAPQKKLEVTLREMLDCP
jgi:hypothetical protein